MRREKEQRRRLTRWGSSFEQRSHKSLTSSSARVDGEAKVCPSLCAKDKETSLEIKEREEEEREEGERRSSERSFSRISSVGSRTC